MQARSCGECTACCQGWLKDDSLEMYPGQPCSHLCDEGCRIYEKRPENPCRVFKCAWLTNPVDFPDHLRPDKSGFIVLHNRPWQEWLVLHATPVGLDVNEETLDFLKNLSEKCARPLVWHVWDQSGEGKITEGQQGIFGPQEFVNRRVAPNQSRNLSGFSDEDVITFQR